MIEQFEEIKSAFINCYGNEQRYFLLFLVAIFILFIEEKNKENRNLLIYYPTLIMAIVFNPFFYQLLTKFVPSNVYYRFFWLLPVGIIIAYLGVILISKVDKKITKLVTIIAFIGIIVYSGKFMYTKTVFEKVDNLYKLPDRCVEVTQIMSAMQMDNKKAMVPTEMIGFVRQLDASIKLAYQRRPYQDYDIYECVRDYNAGNVENLIKFCEKQDVNIIVYDNSIELSEHLINYGYILYSQTDNYDIYALAEKIKKLPDKYLEVIDKVSALPVENPKVIAEEDMLLYRKLIDKEIQFAYEDGVEENQKIKEYYNSGDIKNLVDICKKQDINIIIYDKKIPLSIAPQFYGFECLGQTENYDIYVMLDTLETEISVDEEIIKIKGLKNEYNLCVVNDLHLIADYTEVSEENIETVKDRYENLFKTDSGEKSPKLWTHLPNKVNELNPDLVVFAGDMMDFTSFSNVEILKKGMSKINNDIIYVRADHDYANWYNNAFPQEDVKKLHRSIDENLRNILQRFRRNTSCWN